MIDALVHGRPLDGKTDDNLRASKTSAGKKRAVEKKIAVKFPDPLDKANAEALAKFVVMPSVNAAAVVAEYAKETFGALDLGALAASLSAGMEAVNCGDMKRAEAMLLGQAVALQAIFTNMARRAPKQEYMDHWDAFMRVALKAQNQCRMTLETLATIKNPPVVFARQANINNGGQQQVNNGMDAAGLMKRSALAHTHAEKSTLEQNKLLEVDHGQPGKWMDTRAQGAASRVNPHMATVG